MISVIVYGRNDQHGYNAHRRVALSLNAMAEVLTQVDDEIIFVDYNSPRGMPTLPEAIEDTLTIRALNLLRIIRITPDIHDQVIGDRSTHPISEPHARNAAIRRAHPGNWILSTNTDMVFVTKAAPSLSDVVDGLEGYAYGLPRFEIPEWLWESVPRNDPKHMMALLQEWSGRIGLDEVTLGHEWILYDAPGDFQLLRRSLVEEIHGFDEQMIHGWHVDSNLWKRVYNSLGEIGSLYPQVAGYHANHNRTLTRWVSSQSSGNDVIRFVYGVRDTGVAAQAHTWGLADVELPEIRLTRADPLPWLGAASARAPGQRGPLVTSDSREARAVLGYDARHVLPFLLDPIISTTPRPAVGYVGINKSTKEMLAASLQALTPASALLTDDAALQRADLLVIDLGIDMSTGRGDVDRSEAERLMAMLAHAVPRLHARSPSPDFLLINGMSGVWSEWIDGLFRILYGTYHTRVQAAVMRQDAGVDQSNADMARMLLFLTRKPSLAEPSQTDGGVFDLGQPATIPGLLEGWNAVGRDGAVLDSHRATLRLHAALDSPPRRHAVLDITSWLPDAEARVDDIAVRIAIDDDVLLDGPIHPQNRRNAFHAVFDPPGGSEHVLTVETTTASGAPYEPSRHGGVQPWLRIERLRFLESPAGDEIAAPTEGADAGLLVPIGLGCRGERLLRGWWARSDSDGVWAIADGGVIEVPAALASGEVKIELLGHPDREGLPITVTATGASVVHTPADSIPIDRPQVIVATLPAPRAEGTVALTFTSPHAEAVGPEIVQVRGIGPATRAYAGGACLSLAQGSADLIGLRNGWHAAETMGVWSSEEEATIAFRAIGGLAAGSTLLIEGGVLDARRQKLGVNINGCESRVRRKRHGRLAVTVPKTVTPDEIVIMRLTVSALLTPSLDGTIDDPRMLGAMVTTVTLA